MIQKEGPGWRLARDSLRHHFSVMIGGDDWAFELNEKEWVTLISIVSELIDQHQKLESQLMPEETICLEIGREAWWACLEGDCDAWSLRLVLEGNGNDQYLRGFEAFWPSPAAQSIAFEMKAMSKTSNN